MAATSTPPQPRYTLHPISVPDDYAALTDLSIAAMQSNPFNYLVYPASPAPELERAIWDFQLEMVPQHVADKKRVEAVMRPVGEGVDFSLIDEFRRLGGPLSTKHMRPKTDIVLHLMRVNPAYQKQGLGKMLLDWGLQKAREKGKRVFVLASPTGRRLYEKNGFTVFEEVKLDLAIFGGEGEYTQSVIVWEGREQ